MTTDPNLPDLRLTDEVSPSLGPMPVYSPGPIDEIAAEALTMPEGGVPLYSAGPEDPNRKVVGWIMPSSAV